MGHGDRNLLCFHGFGQSAQVFDFLESDFSETYTIYSFDFLFHGNSSIIDQSKEKQLDKEKWCRLISSFLQENNLEQIDLLGYSMGGRLSFALMEFIPRKIDKVFLFAPDGIWNSFWFNFSTKNPLGKILFKQFVIKPDPFYKVLSFLVKIGILPSKLKQIANINTSNAAKRWQVFNTWSCLTLIRINLNLVEQNISNHKINIEITTGRFDRIIPLKKVLKWAWLKKNSKKLIVLECGHLIPNKHIENRISQHL